MVKTLQITNGKMVSDPIICVTCPHPAEEIAKNGVAATRGTRFLNTRAFQYIYISNVCNGDELTTVYGQYEAIKKRIRIFNENVIDGRSI
jgi:hypothetical protein